MSHQAQKPIIFFDGVCNLCNWFVDFIFKRDKAGHFVVASLQGETAEKFLPVEHRKNLNSVVVLMDQQIHTESTAALKVLSQLGAPWCWFQIFLIIPKFLRDPFYLLIARTRYLIFGKRETCRIPTPEERERFLP